MKTISKIMILAGTSAFLGGLILAGIRFVCAASEEFDFFIPIWNTNILDFSFPLMIGGLVLSWIGVSGRNASNSLGKNKRLQQEGKLAMGTLLHFSSTGTRISHRPVMEIIIQYYLENGRQVTGRCEMLLDEASIGQFKIGMFLPVRYEEEHPEEIVLAQNEAFDDLHQAMTDFQLYDGTLDQERHYIASNGIDAQGVIMKSTPTGRIQGGKTELTLHIKITPPDGEMYETVFTRFVISGCVPYLQAGCVVSIHYLPDDPYNVVIGSRSI